MSKSKTPRAWDTFSAAMTVEGAQGYQTSDSEVYISAIQHLINCGAAWELNGFFGRVAAEAIKEGVCTLPRKSAARAIKTPEPNEDRLGFGIEHETEH